MKLIPAYLLGTITAVMTISMAASASITKALNAQDMLKVKEYAANFKQVKNSQSLLASFRQAKELQRHLQTKLELINSVSDIRDRVFVETYLPAFKLWHNGDGAFVVSLMYGPFLKQAKQTPHSIDDQFFSLLLQASAPARASDYWPAWNTQTWDLGGCNELGKGIFYRLLKAIEKLSDNPGFSRVESEVSELRQQLLEALLNRQEVAEAGPAYCQKLPMQLKELVNIRRSIKLEKGQLSKLDTQINHLKEKVNGR